MTVPYFPISRTPFTKLPHGLLPDDHALRDTFPGLTIYNADRLQALIELFARENEVAKPDLPPDRTITDEQAARMADLFDQFGREKDAAYEAEVAEIYKNAKADSDWATQSQKQEAAEKQKTDKEKGESGNQ